MIVWQTKAFDKHTAENLKNTLDISWPLAALLTQRGVDSKEKAQKFLFGGPKDLVSPYKMKGIDKATARIRQAVENSERIVVYGDYDVDGICSTVIMLKCLEMLGCKADYYIPDRFSEGYGMNEEAVTKLAEGGYDLLISVDCGITSVKEVNCAAMLGMEVIITDHHTPSSELPEAFAVINPKLDDEIDVLNLSGAGVVFKLAEALIGDKAYEWLELAALATVADIMPLLGDNRIIVKEGLKKLKKTKIKGLKALLDKTGLINKEEITPWHLSFIIAPRINSAGRLEKADIGIELFLSDDEERCMELAETLCQLNNERKSLEDMMCKEAVLKVENEINLEEEKIIVVAGDNWHHGVLGIVASRLCEKYNRPTVLISFDGDTGRGSGRSVGDISLYDALFYASSELVHFGGHKMAAGLTIERAKFDSFRNKLCEWAKVNMTESSLKQVCLIDFELKVEDINDELLQEINMLKPYGEGNEPPYFALRKIEVDSAYLVGKDKNHVKMNLKPGSLSAVAFKRPEFFELPYKECYHDVVFCLDYNEFRGARSIQLEIKAMKPVFMPDDLDKVSHEFKNNLFLLEKCLEEIKKSKPVIVLYPTYRVLKKHEMQLKLFFKPEFLCELHGKIPIENRIKLTDDLVNGKSKVFLLTQAFYNYIYKKQHIKDWPAIITFVCDEKAAVSGYCIMEHDDEMWDKIPDIKWKQEWQYNGSEKVLMYANRKETLDFWKEEIPDIFIEAGEKDLEKRDQLRLDFARLNQGIFLTDGGTGRFIGDLDKLVFADMPLSIYEALLVVEQMAAADEANQIVFFSSEKMFNVHDDFLERHYPDINTVKKVLNYLLQNGKNPIYTDLEKLAANINKFAFEDFKPSDLVPILHILTDLGLCQTRKKGSIMEIKLLKPPSSTVDIAESPYYLEGLAEKRAFYKLKSKISKFWRGDDNGAGKNN